MSTNLSPEQQALIAAAIASGRFTSPDEVMTEALKLLVEATGEPSGEAASVETAEQWIEKFHRWTRRPRPPATFVDDSRESIYDDSTA